MWWSTSSAACGGIGECDHLSKTELFFLIEELRTSADCIDRWGSPAAVRTAGAKPARVLRPAVVSARQFVAQVVLGGHSWVECDGWSVESLRSALGMVADMIMMRSAPPAFQAWPRI
jgi:hypothetical protein